MQNTRTNTRTRPTAGNASFAQPPPAMAQQPYQYPQSPDQSDYPNFNFSAPLPNDQLYPTANVYDGNNLAYNFNASQPPTYPTNLAPAPSTELVRRSRDQQLAPLNGDQQEQWNGYSGIDPHSVEDEDEQDLDMKVALAKKDAQGKRKQIPPFVQKLSSFLDSNNTDLIRWSDDGRSFIVLDEDEFARTLIPELFKHNNYASFVRQLNMYGFHKTVNITDGSLRQSEKARKGVKPPSMYSHPYFRKNRPDLLWLIQKPAGTKSAKRKRDGNLKDPYDSDEGSPVPETFGGPPQQLSAPNANTNQDLVQLPRNELAAVRKELQGLQTQQKFISEMIARLKEQNDRQAKNFQALHDRHENSINAILTFLATFYNRSLEGHGGAANLVNMFASAMPQTHQPQTGSVVEEFNDTTPVATPSNQVQRFIKRPPLLLPGPVENQHLQPGSAVTEPSSARGSASPTNDLSNRGRNGSAPPESARPQSAATSPATIKTDAPTPNVLNQVPESNDQMMNLINNVNASTAASTPSTLAPAVDMNSIVDRINQSNSPLTPQQREDMVNTLSQNNLDSTAGALSNWNTSNADFQRRMDESQNTLDYLQQLQKQQDEKVQELNRRLQPLSPTGTIPGLHHFDNSNLDPFDQLGAPGDYNVNDYVNFDDPAPWDHGGDGGGGTDFDFGNTDWTNFNADEGVDNMFGATNDQSADRLAPNQGDGGRVESVSSEATSPADGATGVDEPGTPNKRARRS